MKKILSAIILLVSLSLSACHSQHAADFATGAIYSGVDNYNYHSQRNGHNNGNHGNHRPEMWQKGGILNPYKTTIKTDGGTVFIKESFDFFGNKNITVRDYRY